MPQTVDPTFYRSPAEAIAAPPERLAYVAAYDRAGQAKDAMAVLDCDPSSPEFGRVVGWSELPTAGNELHHFGWNACSSALCHQGHGDHGQPLERRYLVVPGLRSSRTYVLDTKPDPRNPRVVRTIEADELAAKAGYSRPHTVHCGPGGIKARPIFPAADLCNAFEPSIGRCVEDGIGGARDDLGPSPSVDIANGAPTGADATNQIVDAWADGRGGLNHEHVMFATSTNGGATWTAPRAIETAGDRGYYAAPAISPNGTDVWVVYNAFTTPFRNDTSSPRNLVGVVKHADVGSGGTVGGFAEIHRSPGGDPRGSSQNNLAAEFLGDYVYAAATRTYGAAVWNDVRRAADCPAIDAYRLALHNEAVLAGGPVAEPEEPRGIEDAVHHEVTQEPDAVAPPVQQVCAGTFGNSDIFGGTYADPTP